MCMFLYTCKCCSMVPSMGRSVGCCIRGSVCICMGSGVGYLVCFSLRNSFLFFPASIGWSMEWSMFVSCLLV